MKALIVVDIQNDFLENGSLAVKDSNRIIPIVNKLTHSGNFDIVIFTKDWHPFNHKSFASQHEGKNVFDLIDLNGIQQVLWSNHCVQNTLGAEFHKDLDLNIPNLYIFKKGMNPEIDSYSGFYENDHKTSTGLTDFLREKGITEISITGIATDYCVKYTAIDSSKDGFETTLIIDATQGIAEDMKPHVEEMIKYNVKFSFSTNYLHE
jgi:nicotinamidase/pyrazinamidase